jgi:hypothetical protein
VTPGTLVLYGDVSVAYGQMYLNAADGADIASYFRGPDGTGLIGVIGNGAVLGTAQHTGYVLLTVTIDEQDPGPAVAEFEDVVEVSMTTEDERFVISCWGGGESHDLSPLPAGGATYRLRYHMRGADAARGGGSRQIDDPPLDEYLLQVWPAVHRPPSTVKLTSRAGRAMQAMW